MRHIEKRKLYPSNVFYVVLDHKGKKSVNVVDRVRGLQLRNPCNCLPKT